MLADKSLQCTRQMKLFNHTACFKKKSFSLTLLLCVLKQCANHHLPLILFELYLSAPELTKYILLQNSSWGGGGIYIFRSIFPSFSVHPLTSSQMDTFICCSCVWLKAILMCNKSNLCGTSSAWLR